MGLHRNNFHLSAVALQKVGNKLRNFFQAALPAHTGSLACKATAIQKDSDRENIMVSKESYLTSDLGLAERQASTPNALHSAFHSDKEIEGAGQTRTSIIARRLQTLLDRHPRLQRLLWECCSFRHRIRIALSSSYASQAPKDFLWLEGPDGCAYLNIRSLARNEHIRRVSSSLLWATPIDWRSHGDSWNQGVQWAVRNLGSGSPLADEHKALLASESSYHGPKQI